MKVVYRALGSAPDKIIIVKQEKSAQFSAPFHFHEGYEITYVVRGQGKFYGGHALKNFSDGDLYFFAPGYPHYFVNENSFIHSGEIGHTIAVQFKEDCLGKDFFLKDEMKTIRNLLTIGRRGIRIKGAGPNLHLLLMQLTSEKGIKQLILFLSLLHEISILPKSKVTLISNVDFRSSSENKNSNRLDPVYQYVLENFKGNINTDKAASLACMNVSAFCRYFKRRTSSTLSQFVNKVRITHAIYLLEDKDKTILDVCFESGYENLSYFNRQFKLITGSTPFIYRKKLL